MGEPTVAVSRVRSFAATCTFTRSALLSNIVARMACARAGSKLEGTTRRFATPDTVTSDAVVHVVFASLIGKEKLAYFVAISEMLSLGAGILTFVAGARPRTAGTRRH